MKLINIYKRTGRILLIYLINLYNYFTYTSKNQNIKKILKENWKNYKIDLHPIDRRMNILRENKVNGMSTENVRFLFNEIVKQYAKNGLYMEIGTYQGCSLLSAALFNPSTRCIGIDNFSQFDEGCENQEILKANLSKFDNLQNIEFYKGDYEKVIKNIFNKEPNLKINVYFYDGHHSYKNQMDGLRVILPHLEKKCILIIDDYNTDRVERANHDFLKENLEFKAIIKIKTNGNSSKNWWNGIEVIGRGFTTN